jgi:hypothetical protein
LLAPLHWQLARENVGDALRLAWYDSRFAYEKIRSTDLWRAIDNYEYIFIFAIGIE